MALDHYSPCPCGSGKKFKFCCEPIYPGISQAFEQEASGQHDAALRMMDQVVAQHPTNPESWAQKANLLLQQGKADEAELALEQVFKINPNFPRGLILRAMIRLQEGELVGALVLARKASEAFPPDALDALADVYRMIFECEMRLQRPIAGRAALQQRVRCVPGDASGREEFDAIFGDNGILPACARQDYHLRTPGAGVAGPRRLAWDRVLAEAKAPRLTELVRAFAQLTQEDANDAAAWFNLGLARAWLGDNRGALQALDNYLPLEKDDANAEEAATLAEVLRTGAGMEEQSDYVSYLMLFQAADLTPMSNLLNQWSQAGRLLVPQAERPEVFFALVLEGQSTSLVTASSGAELSPLAGYVTISGGVVRFTGPSEDGILKLREELTRKLSSNLAQMPIRKMPLPFHDVVTEALIFPSGEPDALTAQRVMAHSKRFYELTWPDRPRKSLNGQTPRDAVRDPIGRRRVAGVLRFLQDCARGGMMADFSFDELRRVLGLFAPGPIGAETLPAPTPAANGAQLDIANLDAAGLADLVDADLGAEQLELAYQTALRLEANDQAVRFARALVGRPAQPERPDRFPWYQFLITQALEKGDKDAALGYVTDGERFDAEVNEGRRRNDYDLRRGQVHARRGEADEAANVFQRLIDRVPQEMKYRGTAAEILLRLNQPRTALRFAEEGLDQARKQNDRDSEQYLMELVGAARKQMGG